MVRWLERLIQERDKVLPIIQEGRLVSMNCYKADRVIGDGPPPIGSSEAAEVEKWLSRITEWWFEHTIDFWNQIKSITAGADCIIWLGGENSQADRFMLIALVNKFLDCLTVSEERVGRAIKENLLQAACLFRLDSGRIADQFLSDKGWADHGLNACTQGLKSIGQQRSPLKNYFMNCRVFFEGWPHNGCNKNITDLIKQFHHLCLMVKSVLCPLVLRLNGSDPNYRRAELELAAANEELQKVEAKNKILRKMLCDLLVRPSATTPEGDKIQAALDGLLDAKDAALKCLSVNGVLRDLLDQSPSSEVLEQFPDDLVESVRSGNKLIRDRVQSLRSAIELGQQPSDRHGLPSWMFGLPSWILAITNELSATDPAKYVQRVEEAITRLKGCTTDLQGMVGAQVGDDELVVLERRLTAWMARESHDESSRAFEMCQSILSRLRDWLSPLGKSWEIATVMTRLSSATSAAAEALAKGINEMKVRMTPPANSRVVALKSAQKDVLRHLQVCTEGLIVQRKMPALDGPPVNQEQFDHSTRRAILELSEKYQLGSQQPAPLDLAGFARDIGVLFLNGTLESKQDAFPTQCLWEFFPTLSTHVLAMFDRAKMTFSIDFARQPPIDLTELVTRTL